jgi:type I restriction enzyme S subunit
MSGLFPTTRVADLCALVVDCVNKTAPKVEGPTPWRMLRTPDVREGRVNTFGLNFVDEHTFERWTRRAQLARGDVILTREAPVGEVARVREAKGLFLGQRLLMYRADLKRCDPTFLFFAMRSPSVKAQFHAQSGTGSVVDHLRVPDCSEFLIPTPPLPEQRRIASLLGALDEKIELNRRMNATLEEMARALFRAWFVDFDPVHARAAGEAPAHMPPETAALFPDSFGEDGLPMGWQRKPFLDFVEIIGGGTPKTKESAFWDGPIPWFSVVDAPANGNVFVHSTAKSITERGLAESSARLIRAGATIISARGTVGKVAMCPAPMTFNQSCYGLLGRQGAGDGFTYLATLNMVERLQSMAHGSVFSTITRDTFIQLEIAAPSAAILASFEAAVWPLFAKIRQSGQESRTLAALRDALLPRLMSGELRVRDAEAMVEGAV